MKRMGILLGLLFVLGATDVVSAQPQNTESPGESRATEFRAVEGPTKENIPGGPLLVIAYGVVWMAVFGYVLHLGKQLKRTGEDLARVEKALGSSSSTGAPRAND